MQYDHFLELAYTLVRIKDLNQLLDTVLQRLRDMLSCDAGSIYLYNSDTKELTFKFTQNDSVRLPFKEFSMPVNKNSIAGYAALTKRAIRINDVYRLDKSFPFKFNSNFDKMSGYRTKSMLVFPVTDINNELTGVLQFINKKRAGIAVTQNNADKLVIPFSKEDENIARSLVGIVSLALENGVLYASVEAMMEGLITAIVMAVESRDPFNIGHTNRVTTLATILAQAMNEDMLDFPHFSMSKTDMKMLRFACMLHDVGKVGIKEKTLHKVDKLHEDRLKLIESKIKLAKAMAQIEGKGDEELSMLDDFLLSVHTCNQPFDVKAEEYETLVKAKEYTFKDVDDREDYLMNDADFRSLSIKQGIYSDAERREIDSHAKYTYEFLKSIPWAKEYRDIPEISSQHHEKMNGSGFPFGLKGDEINIYGRIIAIVDVFDTLTARDVPYSPAMMAEDACRELIKQAEANILDAEIVRFFIKNHLYRRV